LTTVFNDCQTTNFAKQLLVRTTKVSGIFDIFGQVGGAYLRNDQDPGSSKLYQSFMGAFNPQETATCENQAT
jgi:hypothetical protein